MDLEVLSKFCITVAPVVVKPDIDSKKESIKLKFGVPKKNGNAPIRVKTIHEIRVRRKADRISTSLCLFLKIKEIFNPVNKHRMEITKKTTQSVPF
tara:strand:- start:602 stop:889 length:288 start_codon:yes stop_codon:yes gene_type:complete